MIRAKLFILLGFCIGSINSNAQDRTIQKEYYIAKDLPDSLKQDANSVLRYKLEEFNIKGPGKATLMIHSIVTILNEKGNDEAQMVLPYNRRFNSIGSFEMKVYNAEGTLLKKYHKSDMYDRSAIDNESIVTEDRILAIEHTISSYPITVEMIFDMDLKSLIGLGRWNMQSPEQSVQNSYYKLSISGEAGFRYLNKNTAIAPEKTTNDKTDSYWWKLNNVKAIKLEDGAEAWSVLPKIYFSANSFEFYGMPGDLSSWQAYGKWVRALNLDGCTLSPQRAEEIKKMTADIKTDKEKVKFLYEYMQQSMRYVSITLGIGGLKPFPATFVDQKKYGDCKALSNYMYSLLKAVNIPSCYALVNAGSNMEPADPSFPDDPFNHVILCVPLKGDTTWLECTSSTSQFGRLGPFTENRYALLIDDSGGKLVKTPRSSASDHQLNSEVHLILDANGGARAAVRFFSTGEYRAEYIGINSLKTDQQKEYLIRMLRMKQPSAFEFKPALDKDGTKEVDMDLEFDKFSDVSSGDKQFYRPKVFDLWSVTVPVEEHRKTDYYFDIPVQKSCITTIDLPAGFEVETLPVNQSLKFSYGTYEVKYVYNAANNQVISSAKFNLTNHVIPAAKYNEMQQYMDAVAKAQNKKLVIRKKV